MKFGARAYPFWVIGLVITGALLIGAGGFWLIIRPPTPVVQPTPIAKATATPGPTATMPLEAAASAETTATPIPPTATPTVAWYRVTAYNVDGVPGPPSAPYPARFDAAQQTTIPLTARAAPSVATSAGVQGFVKRIGSQLVLNGQPFRFSGPNIYWLGLAEVPSLSYPSQFQVDDALATAALMGATVVRAHSLGFSTGCSLCIEPTLGHFNEIALQHVDFALKTARDHGLRLILPLTDNSHYGAGGKRDFTDWRGIADESNFYSNPTVINDFKEYINVMINRVNTYTGVAYKDDPTILAWETGNELDAPVTWVDTISTYIKSLDSNHLVVDGDWGRSQLTDDLPLPNCDIYSIHGYPMSVQDLDKAAAQTQQAGKAFLLGEYGWKNIDKYGKPAGDPLTQYLADIESQPVVAGDLYWDLFPHADDHGFVQHNDEPGINAFTLHYPGDDTDMRSRVLLLRAHAYRMRRLPLPPADPPGVPFITGINTRDGPNVVSWRGAAGADTYTVERAPSATGPWTAVCTRCVTDNTTPWIDPTSIRSYPDEVQADGPAGYWRLDDPAGTTAVAAGGQAPGTYAGGVTPAQPGALINPADRAIAFDGTSGAVLFGNHYDFAGQAPFSLEAWVYPTVIDTGFRRIFSKETYNGATNPPTRQGYSLSFSTTANGGLFFSRASGPEVDDLSYPAGLAPNAWNYVVATYDGAIMTLYLDGAAVVTRKSTLALLPTAVEFSAGKRADGGDFLAGKLDELAVYPVALSPLAISTHYKAASMPTTLAVFGSSASRGP
jgi:hypothetical protein